MTAQAHDTNTAGRPARRAAAALPGGEQSRVVVREPPADAGAVRELPAAAFAPEAAS